MCTKLNGNILQASASVIIAVMIEGSWLPFEFPVEEPGPSLEKRVGFIPIFPVPNPNTQTTTMMGGWELAIPKTSKIKDLAWEFLMKLRQMGKTKMRSKRKEIMKIKEMRTRAKIKTKRNNEAEMAKPEQPLPNYKS